MYVYGHLGAVSNCAKGSVFPKDYLSGNDATTTQSSRSLLTAGLLIGGATLGLWWLSKTPAVRMLENPGRPPRGWMRRCTQGVAGSAYDPGAVCGALWHHKLSAAQKRAILRREER